MELNTTSINLQKEDVREREQLYPVLHGWSSAGNLAGTGVEVEVTFGGEAVIFGGDAAVTFGGS